LTEGEEAANWSNREGEDRTSDEEREGERKRERKTMIKVHSNVSRKSVA
jgi:hypothetical protein